MVSHVFSQDDRDKRLGVDKSVWETYVISSSNVLDVADDFETQS